MFSGLSVTAPVNNVLARMAELTNNIAKIKGIVSRITALLHDFVSRTYYQLAFGGMAEEIFEAYRKDINAVLGKVAPDALVKIPSIMERLAEGEDESISQAMTTARRGLTAFADAVQPPSDQKLVIDGQEVDATAQHHLNRLRYFLSQRCHSSARRSRLNKTVTSLHERFSASTHGDMRAEEARTLFVLLYVTLGELLSFADGRPAEPPIGARP